MSTFQSPFGDFLICKRQRPCWSQCAWITFQSPFGDFLICKFTINTLDKACRYGFQSPFRDFLICKIWCRHPPGMVDGPICFSPRLGIF